MCNSGQKNEYSHVNLDPQRHVTLYADNRAQCLRLVAQDGDIGDGLAAIGKHHRDIDQHPAAVMDRIEPAASDGPGQLGIEPDTVRRGAIAPA